jgi:GNAT superfamily N-acetyltransferase
MVREAEEEMIVRRVDVSDEVVREGLNTMLAECFVPGDWQTERLPKAKTGFWWVAFDGRKPAGFACMRPSVRWGDTGYLSVSGVLKPWRGKRLQRRLIQARVAYARALAWHTVITDTMHDNVASMRSLMACGFRPYSPQVRWGDADHAVYWVRSTEPKLAAA